MRISFDFIDLETFLSVYDTGSYQRAASLLGLSQSSVTRRIQKLETELDTKLFDRTTRDVKPTLAAKRLKMRAENILSETRAAQTALRDDSAAFAFQRARSVSIAVVPTLVASIISPAIKLVRATEPGCRIRVIDVSANAVAEAVSQGDADFGVCPLPAHQPDTRFERLFDDAIVLALPRSHPLARQDEVRWSDLSGETLILPERGTGNRMLIDDAMAHSDVPLRWSFEVGRSTTSLDLVVDGLGIAPLPMAALTKRDNVHVENRPLVAPVVTRPVGLLTRTSNVPSGLAQSLVQAIENCARATA